MDKTAYQSAGVLPAKLIRDKGATAKGIIWPRHIQLILTNRCNGGCRWCSCGNVDRAIEMPADEACRVLDYFARLDCRACTITGGGEPTLHPAFGRIVSHARSLGIELGLATNGLNWSAEDVGLDVAAIGKTFSWVRMSITDTESGDYDCGRILRLAKRLFPVPVGVSFTVTDKASLFTAQKIVDIAESTENISHVRFVGDLLADVDMEKIGRLHGNREKVIVQHRGYCYPGAKRCLIGQLKPLIGADGYVYPCCGVQYARAKPSRELGEDFRMCHWLEFGSHGPVFDGSKCARCYYSAYNEYLSARLSPAGVDEAFL